MGISPELINNNTIEDWTQFMDFNAFKNRKWSEFVTVFDSDENMTNEYENSNFEFALNVLQSTHTRLSKETCIDCVPLLCALEFHNNIGAHINLRLISVA